jgi:arylsulfatase
MGDWKAIRTNLNPRPAVKDKTPGAIELYNLKDDPTESRNVAAEHPDIVAKMAAIMKEQHVTSPLWPIRALDGDIAEQGLTAQKKAKAGKKKS